MSLVREGVVPSTLTGGPSEKYPLVYPGDESLSQTSKDDDLDDVPSVHRHGLLRP